MRHSLKLRAGGAGDLDLTPETGQYRLSANAPGVELNELRKTLGIKPLPYPIAGAARGVLHCTGLLEEPVFSGVLPTAPFLACKH